MMHLTEEQVFDFIEGTLPVAEHSSLARHIDECAYCRSQITLARSVNVALASQSLVEPSKNFTQEVMRNIENITVTAPTVDASRRQIFVWNPSFAIPGVLVLIAGLCVAPFFAPSHVSFALDAMRGNGLTPFLNALTKLFANPLTPICLSAAIIVGALGFIENIFPKSGK